MSDFDVNEFLAQSANVGEPVSTDNSDDPNDIDALLSDEGNLFDNVDIEALPEDPFGVPDGTYRFRITDVKFKVTNATKDLPVKKVGVTFSYAIADGPYEKRWASEWLYFPTKIDGEDEGKKVSALANLRNHLIAFGLSSSDLATFNHRNAKDMLDGNEFYGTVVNKKDKQGVKRLNFNKWVSLDGAGTGDDYDPFAS
jgi:hypothetical protein